MLLLLADDNKPPVSAVGLFSCAAVVRARLMVCELGGAGARGAGELAKGLKPDAFEDATFGEEFSGFFDFEVFCLVTREDVSAYTTCLSGMGSQA